MTLTTKPVLAYVAAPLVAFVAMFAAAAAFAPPGTSIMYSVVTGVLSATVVLAWMVLRPLLGATSAVAAVCLGSGVLFAVLAWLVPGMCSEVVANSVVLRPCTSTEVLQWSAAGAVLPLIMAVLLTPLVLATVLLRRVALRRKAQHVEPGQ